MGRGKLGLYNFVNFINKHSQGIAMSQQTQNKAQINKGSIKNQPKQPEYKDKPMQDLQDEKKSAQSRDKSCGSDATGKLKSKQGQSMSSGAKDEGCCS